jgi:hypothetical protein
MAMFFVLKSTMGLTYEECSLVRKELVAKNGEFWWAKPFDELAAPDREEPNAKAKETLEVIRKEALKRRGDKETEETLEQMFPREDDPAKPGAKEGRSRSRSRSRNTSDQDIKRIPGRSVGKDGTQESTNESSQHKDKGREMEKDSFSSIGYPEMFSERLKVRVEKEKEKKKDMDPEKAHWQERLVREKRIHWNMDPDGYVSPLNMSWIHTVELRMQMASGPDGRKRVAQPNNEQSPDWAGHPVHGSNWLPAAFLNNCVPFIVKKRD